MVSIKDVQDRISPKFDEKVLMKILREKAKCENVKVVHISIGDESKKGDSYLSTVVRFSVEAKTENNGNVTINIIVKAYPKNIGRRKTFRSVDFFNNEVAFYEKVWPELQSFQNTKNIKDKFENIPLLLAAYADETDGFIAMEDLSFAGFKMAQRDVGLDFAHATMIMQLFAKFHGLAFAHKQQNPAKFTKMANELQETYFAEKFRVWYSNYEQNMCEIVKDAVKRQLEPKYLEKITEFFDTDFLGSIIKLCQIRGPLSVITHGDAWLPNFLMLYENDKPISVKLIDFQLTRCTSLAMDLLFVFYSCMDQSLRLSHWDQLLQVYREHFVKFVEELGSDAQWVTVSVIEEDMRANGAFAVGMNMEGNIMALLEEDEVADIDDIEGDDAIPLENIWIIHPIKSEDKRQRLADTIKHIIDMKFI